MVVENVSSNLTMHTKINNMEEDIDIQYREVAQRLVASALYAVGQGFESLLLYKLNKNLIF